MKTNIKHSVFDLIICIIGFSISLIGFIVLVTDDSDTASRFWGTVGYFVFFLIATIMLLDSIKNIQWFNITGGYITVYCPFGIIKQMELKQIKKAFKTNAVIYRIKMLSISRPYIVLCINKSVTNADIDDAYNRKKKKYILIPYSKEAEILVCAEYKKMCGEELVIRL